MICFGLAAVAGQAQQRVSHLLGFRAQFGRLARRAHASVPAYACFPVLDYRRVQQAQRHRGIAAVEWTIREGDPIAGGTIYHLADQMDAGAIAAQEWVFVKKGETARELWERALAPLGQKLLGEVIDYATVHKTLPAKPQDEQFATNAPKLSRPKH